MRSLSPLLALAVVLLAPVTAHAAPAAVSNGVISYGDGAALVHVTVTAATASCGVGCVHTTASFVDQRSAVAVGPGCVVDPASDRSVTCSVTAPSAATVRITGGADADFVDASASTLSPVAATGAGDDALVWCGCVTTAISIDGGGGTNDSLNFDRSARGIKLVGTGISGIETLVGTPHADVLDVPVAAIYATAGNDIVRSGALKQAIDLGDGNDVFVEQRAATFAQRVVGGLGRDRYEATGTKREKFEVCLDERSVVCPEFDGRKGEQDTVGGDIEDVRMFGTSADLLIGSRVANTLEGGGGNDIFTGGLGADTYRGGAGLDLVTYAIPSLDARGVRVTLDGRRNDGNPRSDFIHRDIEIAAGTAKNDRLVGGKGLDALFGDAGNDTIIGGKGPDLLVGGPGNDYIDARDGVKDELECGAGSDRIRADLFDKIKRDCEFRTFR
ncbi:MAG: hypothetical protein JWO69_414 [Thermoleophilia bacterium]|nr:hypothetical protein [Thermoleophilia bacterium]